MPIKKKRRTLIYSRRKINEAEDLWLVMFQDTLIALSGVPPDDLHLSPYDAAGVAHRARLLADAALDEYSDRWARRRE
jgi:hypothetical protein